MFWFSIALPPSSGDRKREWEYWVRYVKDQKDIYGQCFMPVRALLRSWLRQIRQRLLQGSGGGVSDDCLQAIWQVVGGPQGLGCFKLLGVCEEEVSQYCRNC